MQLSTSKRILLIDTVIPYLQPTHQLLDAQISKSKILVHQKMDLSKMTIIFVLRASMRARAVKTLSRESRRLMSAELLLENTPTMIKAAQMTTVQTTNVSFRSSTTLSQIPLVQMTIIINAVMFPLCKISMLPFKGLAHLAQVTPAQHSQVASSFGETWEIMEHQAACTLVTTTQILSRLSGGFVKCLRLVKIQTNARNVFTHRATACTNGESSKV
jgi:hypothetical protein